MLEVTGEVMVVNSLGIHARPAASLVQRVLTYDCEVFLSNNGYQVNAKSIMGLLTLAATHGSRLQVLCKGEDAEEALAAVQQIFASGFGEE